MVAGTELEDAGADKWALEVLEDLQRRSVPVPEGTTAEAVFH